MANITEIFAEKFTENGDKSYNTTGNTLLDVLFMTEYYQKHLDEVPFIGQDEKAKLFAMFIRDPRFGMGKRDLGRTLMYDAKNTVEDIVFAGRFDDIWTMFRQNKEQFHQALDFLKIEIEKGNELCKKWMPRYSSKNLLIAREIAKYWGMNKQQYGHFIKTNTTVENKLSLHNDDMIKFEHVPSMANLKYANTFKNKETLKDRYAQYMEDVCAGKKELHVSTATPYDIYKNVGKLGKDVDIFFDKLEKISGSWIPVVDTSGSMQDSNDSFGKALSIGHYLAKCSNYAPNKVISFSSKPQLITIGETKAVRNTYGYYEPLEGDTQYAREINSMYTGDWSNTDFGAVCNLLKKMDPANAPEYLVILSDMEFDAGSRNSAAELKEIFQQYGFNTNIVWWNFNSRNKTCPFMQDQFGNIYLSGYNPILLKFLQAGFDGIAFLDKLLDEYKKYMESCKVAA